MRSAQEAGFHRRLDLLACLAGVHFVQNVEERRDLTFDFLAVYSVADSNISYTL